MNRSLQSQVWPSAGVTRLPGYERCRRCVIEHTHGAWNIAVVGQDVFGCLGRNARKDRSAVGKADRTDAGEVERIVADSQEQPEDLGSTAPQSTSERMVSLSRQPSRIVIVGGGAAGFAAAEMLRRSGYQRSLLMLSADSDLPVDRPNLSKDYLAGTAPEEWVSLKPESWYRDHGIDLRLNTEMVNLHAGVREVELHRAIACPTTACCLQPARSL